MTDTLRRRPIRVPRVLALTALAIPLIASLSGIAQELRNVDRVRGKTMLKTIRKELQNHYYDPAFNGIDLDARFKKAEQAVEEAASVGQIFGIIAQAVLELNDSHTRFVPPSRVAKFDYGWRMRLIDGTPYILAVKPGSDAESKGLRVGDRILSVDGIPLNRQNSEVFLYRYFVIRPVPAMNLIVQSPGGSPRGLTIETKIEMGKRVLDITQGEDVWDILRQSEDSSDVSRAAELEDKTVFVWNIPSFSGTEDQFKQFTNRLKRYRSVVLDLRGNAGGYLDRLTLLLGYFFDHDVTVGVPRARGKDLKPVIAKSQGDKVFTGKLVVLVDSDSYSAAELFARVIQIEKRGTVVGDRTTGAVMQTRFYTREMGGDNVVLYGIAIAESELIMSDGQNLEKAGVVPDIAATPTAEDLAAGRDPVLSRALAVIDTVVSPENAGKFFPYMWKD